MKQLTIDALYAFVVRNPDGNEGVVGIQINGGWMPMIGADLERIEQLRPYVQETANGLKKPIQLVRFDRREELDVVSPNRLSTTESVTTNEESVVLIVADEDPGTLKGANVMRKEGE